MASGRQVDYDLRLNSNAAQILNRDSAAAAKFDNSMWQVQKTLASVGLGLGAHFLIDAAKDWTQAAADYETSMLRIKNASHEGFGVLNQDFIKKQVETFKIGLQESADAYGKFLFFVRNAPYSNDTLNRMYTDILTVSKVAGLPQESIDAAINNTAKMLSEGILEGRTLRQLSRVHAPLIPFLADAMGLKSGVKDEFSAIINNDSMDEKTMNQKLSFLISSGKLTKAALDPSVLIKAWDEYAKSVQEKLPETLNTIQSHLNELSNTWLNFKNSMVLDQKPELTNFFHDLENGIHWLSEHEEQIISTAKDIFQIVKMYAEWRLALMALQAPLSIIGFFTKEYERLSSITGAYSSLSNSLFGTIEKQTLAYRYEAQSINEVSTALIRLKDIQNEQGFGYVRDSKGNIVGTLSKEEEVLGSSAAAETGEISIVTGGILEALSSTGAIALGIAALTVGAVIGLNKVKDAIDESNKREKEQDERNRQTEIYNKNFHKIMSDLTTVKDPTGKVHYQTNISNYDFLQGAFEDTRGTLFEKSLEGRFNIGDYKFKNLIAEHSKEIFSDLGKSKDALLLGTLPDSSTDDSKNSIVYQFLEDELNKIKKEDLNTTEKSKNANKLIDSQKTNHLKGNSTTNINIHINELNGMKNSTFKEVDGVTINQVKNEVGIEITRMMLEIINDSQIVRSSHA